MNMSKTMSKGIAILVNELEKITKEEQSLLFGGGTHYYVDSLGNITEKTGEEYEGFAIHCNGELFQLEEPLSYSTYGSSYYGDRTYITNGTYGMFTFLSYYTNVEYGYFCHLSEEEDVGNVPNDTPGFIITSGDERDGYLGYPSDSNYNTQIHSHPKSDGVSGSSPSIDDIENKDKAIEEDSPIKNYGVYNPRTGQTQKY